MIRTHRLPAVFSFLTLLLALQALPAQAQGLILPRPIPPVPAPQPLAVKSQKVTMDLKDGAMKVEVQQVFHNPNRVQMEGTYLFPLPPGAVVSNFRMTIDKEPVEGKLLTVEEARRVYESYVRRSIDPAILEYVGRNAFQARVFPIPAGGEKQISLTYSQTLPFNGGIYQAVYPLSSERVTGGTAGDLVIDCTLRSATALKSVYSPTHEIQVKRESDHLARATFEAKAVRADRDFVLYYSISEKAFGLHALAHRRTGEDGYLLLMLAPKQEVNSSEIQPKDVVFVVDTSGSMQGEKIEQARKALQTILGALNEQDRFNIIRFSSDVTPFRESVVPATRENRDAARAFVEAIRAVGGTAIDDALQAGLASIPKPEERQGRSPYLVFMTDGLPTIGVTDVERILQNTGKAAAKDVRLFTFGVGSDVNTLLLDRLALDYRGAADYISQNEDLETRIGSFYTKIADPVLGNLQLNVNGAKLADVYPGKLPDLFAGTQLLVLARYQGGGKAQVALAGERVGKPQKYAYEVTLPERELGNDFIPRLWGSRKIGFLLEEIRLRGESKELKDEVIRLSKEFGIVTPYTAYLVEEPDLPRPGTPTPFGAVRQNLFREDQAGGFRGGQGGQKPAAGLPGASRPKLQPQEAERLKELSKEVRLQNEGFGRSTGQNAVEASKRVRYLKDIEQAQAEVEVSRSVGGRAFRFAEGRWVDQTVPPKGARTVPVRYGSEAYFQLIRSRADWARLLSVGRDVTVRTGKTTVVVVGEKGKEKLSAAELKALEK